MRAIMQKNDDIQIDSESDLDDSVLAEEHQGDTIKKLREKLKAAEEKAKEYLNELQIYILMIYLHMSLNHK